MKKTSLTLRLTALIAAAFAAVLVGLGSVILRACDRHFEEGDLAELYAKLELARHVLAGAEGPDAAVRVSQQLDAALVGHEGMSIAVVQADGTLVFASSGAAFPATQVGATPPARDALHPPPRLWRRGDEVYRGIVADLPAEAAGGRPTRVVISLDIAHHLAFMAAFERSLWAAIAFAIALSALLGWLTVRAGLAPLRRVAAVASGASAHNLGGRIDLGALPVELHHLGGELNAMMTRLEQAFGRLSAFSSDIAHELRTPISNLTTQTQVALSRARSAEAYRDVLHSNLEELDRLARMVADMLFLAKADHGLLPHPAKAVALEAEARELAEFYEAYAEEKGVRLAVAGAASVTGDRLMLRRALSNLLSNAVRHTPAGGTVTIDIAAEGGGARLAVRNPGAPIPAEHLPRLFERFHRVDPARTRHSDGAGLGLAITRSIVLAHGGRIGVESTPEGTAFTLWLPAAPPGAAAAG